MHLVVFCIGTHIWADHEPLVLVEVILGSKGVTTYSKFNYKN